MSQHNQSPFETNFHDVLRRAAVLGASDLHIEPFEDRVVIRVRVDGVLGAIQEIVDAQYIERFLQQAKRACRFDMSRIGTPQDARFQASDVPFDLRASLMPTLFGEKIVLRLLERDKNFSLEKTGVPEGAKKSLREALSKWQGLVLVTGPTGSGKTTLLYSALAEIDRAENNVHTLEDPVEYTLAGVVQTQISKGGIRFSEALAALMRQDPDCILVGEIRDEETAEAAIHAASTGHLVLSTVHANSAIESIERVSGLGVKRDLIEANLLFASAQRLVPKNCYECAREDFDAVPLVKAVFGEKLVPMRSDGCASCNHTGVKGRVLFFEHIARETVSETNQKQLVSCGSLKACALEALKKGEINAQNASAFY